MDFSQLPFDEEHMLAGLRPWIECESPTFDAAAVNRMMDLAAYDLIAMGAKVERIAGRMGFGDSIRAVLPHPNAGAPGILISGHMDTVHPIGTLNSNPFKRESNKCWGPGIQDMKGGNYLSLEAIRQLIKADRQTPLPVTVLFTPDEEVGTPSTRELIEATASANKYVLVPEPARPDGGVTWGRYAIARFDLEAIGIPIHAGVDPRLGKSAIKEMARRILEIEQMTSDDCTFSVGVVHAGQWVNCVADKCRAEALSMAKKQQDLDSGVRRMLALNSPDPDSGFHVSRGVTRPVWEPDEQCKALHKHAQTIAADLGFDIPAAMSGGGSDGNFTGAMGIPTLDSLGVRGAGLHTLTEHIEIDSLVERGKLMAGLLATLN
ncbi:carboxypeptidase [Chromatiales bacterium (ex Bugula neritina AB1)]|nr:carboxypeptidase [Chromatiales bacterium (ex Bugula neritina AB1)]